MASETQAAAKPNKAGGCLKTGALSLLAILAIAFVGNFVQGFLNGPTAPAAVPTPALSVAELERLAVTVPFDDLARSTEQHTGKYLDLTGEVAQVIEDGDGAGLRVYVDGDVDQAVYVQYPGYAKKRVLVNDMVQMIARVDGRVTYETVLGNKVTVPALTALWLRVK